MINLSSNIQEFILNLARANSVRSVVLFGSRARGTNRPQSDIDIAISGGNFNGFIDGLEDAPTLLEFDVVNLDERTSGELKNEIKKDGVILYEEIR